MPLPRSVGIRRTAVPAALSAALLLTAAACSSGGGSSSSSSSAAAAAAAAAAAPSAKACSGIPAGPINVYNIIPLTGPTATSGQLIEAIAGVAADYFNAHNSICGHQIAVHNIDDKGDPATSLGIARQLVNSGATIVMQDSFGAAEDLIHPYLMQHKVLIVNGNGAYSLYNAKQNPYSFSVGPSNQEYAEVMVNWAKSHGYDNIGILTDGSSFGNELGRAGQHVRPADRGARPEPGLHRDPVGAQRLSAVLLHRVHDADRPVRPPLRGQLIAID